MANSGILIQGLVPGATGPTGDTNLRLLSKPLDQLRAEAEKNKYPQYVTPDRGRWLAAKTPEERAAAKVLVHSEEEHRTVAPLDFKGKKGD